MWYTESYTVIQYQLCYSYKDVHNCKCLKNIISVFTCEWATPVITKSRSGSIFCCNQPGFSGIYTNSAEDGSPYKGNCKVPKYNILNESIYNCALKLVNMLMI